MKRKRTSWIKAELDCLRRLHPSTLNKVIARKIGRSYSSVSGMATTLGLKKTREHIASIPAVTGMLEAGRRFRYPKGHVPANKGTRRPGFAVGRMAETQFKKGHFPANRDPDFYVIGALRVNTEGYIDMRTSFGKGALGWRTLHRILWEDANGPIPKGCKLRFKNGDKLDVELGNLELVSEADVMRRNSIHHLPPLLKETIQTLGRLKRRIREKQDRRSA